MARRWKGVLALEGVQTGDGRLIAEGAIKWAALPLPLIMMPQSNHGAADVVNVGTIESIERVDNKIMGEGLIDDGENGQEVVRMMDAGTAPFGHEWGVSIDPDDIAAELVDAAPVEADDASAVDEDGDLASAIADASVYDCTDPDGECVIIASAWVTRGPWHELGGAGEVTGWLLQYKGERGQALANSLVAAAGEPMPDDAVVLDEMSMDKFVERITRMRIRGATLCGVPAFAEARIALTSETDDAEEGDDAEPSDDVAEPEAEAVIVAGAGGPARPPRDWFFYPEPDEGDERLVPQFDVDTGEYIGDAVPLFIGDDGQVYGHLAPRDRCHIGFAGICVTPPESASAYAHFHVGYTMTMDGDEQGVPVPTGHLVTNADHASAIGLDSRDARDWYANKAFAWANVRVTPGKFGPWVTGALLPGITEELVVALRGGGISGDWRGENGSLELISILAVNTPGFTVQRALVASAGAVKIARTQSFMSVEGNKIKLINRPVQRFSAEPSHACDKCGGVEGVVLKAHDSEELRLLRAIYASTAGPQAKAKLAARLRP